MPGGLRIREKRRAFERHAVRHLGSEQTFVGRSRIGASASCPSMRQRQCAANQSLNPLLEPAAIHGGLMWVSKGIGVSQGWRRPSEGRGMDASLGQFAAKRPNKTNWFADPGEAGKR